MKAIRLVLVLSLLMIAAGCAVTSGATFSSVIAADKASASSRDDSRQSTDTETVSNDEALPRLRVTSDPDNADVYLNGFRQGSTPLDLTDVDPGNYRLTVSRNGYYPVDRWISVPRTGSLTVDVSLVVMTGYIDVTATPADAIISVDGTRLPDGFAELPVGVHDVRVRRFGYEDYRQSIRIHDQEVERVSVDLEVSPFHVDDFGAWRKAFSPLNAGTVGTTALSYQVTAPGSGEIRILNESGSIVRTVSQGPYDTWDQSYRWDGTDANGQTVPDGYYSVELSATGEDGRVENATTSVQVNSALVVVYRSIWGSAPGLLFAPTNSALPAGQVQTTLQIAGIITLLNGDIVTRFPGRAGVRIGVGSDVELAGYAGYTAHSDPLDDHYSAGGSISWHLPLADGIFDPGIIAGAAYRSPSADGHFAGADTQAGFPGYYVALPLQFAARPVSFVIAPEYRLTPAPVVYDASLPSNSWGSILYLRGGVVADLDAVTLGASAAFRSTRLTTAGIFGLDLPFQLGAELHWIVPASSVALSAFVASEITSISDFYVMSGFGVGVLF